MAVVDPTIKKIQLGDGEHLLSASFILDNTNPASPVEKTWQDIKDLVSQATDLVVDPLGTGQLPPANQESYDTYYHDIVLIPDPDETSNYIQYIIQRKGTDPNYTYEWVEIGTTQTDLSNYVKKAIYTSGTPSTNVTGEGGACTVTTSSDGAQTATGEATLVIDMPTSMSSESLSGSGTATITYQKSSDQTQSAGSNSTTSNTSENGGVTITGSNFNFNGASTTFNVNIDYTPEGTLSGSVTVPAHSHSVNATTASITYVTGVSESGTVNVATGVTSDGTSTVVTGITSTTTDVVTEVIVGSPVTVVKNAIKGVSLESLATATTGAIPYIDSITGSAPELTGTQTFVTGYPNFTGGSLTGTKIFNTDAIKNASLTGQTTFFNSATVDAGGVLSFGNGTVGITTTAASTASVGYTQASLGTASTSSVGITKGSYTYTQQHLNAIGTTLSADDKTDVPTSVSVSGTTAVLNSVSISGTTVALNGVKISSTTPVIKSTGLTTSSATFMTGATLGQQSSFTVDSSNFTFNGSPVTLTQAIDYTPSGTIGGSQTVVAHSHTYVELKAHTHGITLTNTSTVGTASVDIAGHTHTLNTTSTTITGTAAVAVSSHTHSVTIANHTHSLNNHTHDVDLTVTPSS